MPSRQAWSSTCPVPRTQVHELHIYAEPSGLVRHVPPLLEAQFAIAV